MRHMKSRMRACSVCILLALGALASLGPSGLNPLYQMAVKGVLKLQLPVREEQSHFDTISKRAYAASLVQHEVVITDGDRNATWESVCQRQHTPTPRIRVYRNGSWVVKRQYLEAYEG